MGGIINLNPSATIKDAFILHNCVFCFCENIVALSTYLLINIYYQLTATIVQLMQPAFLFLTILFIVYLILNILLVSLNNLLFFKSKSAEDGKGQEGGGTDAEHYAENELAVAETEMFKAKETRSK